MFFFFPYIPFRNHLAENDGHLALNFIWVGVQSFVDARMGRDECGRGKTPNGSLTEGKG
jgi:hypothetical protein